jgi:hypothetical protein
MALLISSVESHLLLYLSRTFELYVDLYSMMAFVLRYMYVSIVFCPHIITSHLLGYLYGVFMPYQSYYNIPFYILSMEYGFSKDMNSFLRCDFFFVV